MIRQQQATVLFKDYSHPHEAGTTSLLSPCPLICLWFLWVPQAWSWASGRTCSAICVTPPSPLSLGWKVTRTVSTWRKCGMCAGCAEKGSPCEVTTLATWTCTTRWRPSSVLPAQRPLPTGPASGHTFAMEPVPSCTWSRTRQHQQQEENLACIQCDLCSFWLVSWVDGAWTATWGVLGRRWITACFCFIFVLFLWLLKTDIQMHVPLLHTHTHAHMHNTHNTHTHSGRDKDLSWRLH